MAYAIMRMAKIKSKRDVVMSLEHNTRARIPANSDPQKVGLNRSLGGDTADCLRRFDSVMPEKIRKNAVLAVELVMTASPDFNGKWDDYLMECDKWALKTFGIDPNTSDLRPMIHAVHHYDEKTPHTHMIIVPVKDGKLNAKFFIGGSRDRMAELQQSFYDEVGKKFELARGQSREETRARHSHHNLSAKADQLDEREKKLTEAAAEIKKVVGVTPGEINELRTYKANWEKTTPTGLRVIAQDIERSGAKTVGEYSQLRKTAREREISQGYKTSR